MKKLLLASGILLLGYHYRESIFGKKDADVDEPHSNIPNDETLDNMPNVNQTENQIFTIYDNQVIADSDNIWMLVLNGKLYTATSLETLQKWQKANFKKPPVVMIDQHVWKEYSPTRYGGQF